MHSADIDAFKQFPFLRDEYFLKLLAGLKPPPGDNNFSEFLFKTQITYYCCYVDKCFNANSLLASTSAAPPKCPFSRAKNCSNMKFIVDEAILRANISMLYGGQISVSSINTFKGANFQVIRQGECAISALDAFICTGGEFSVCLDAFQPELPVICSEKAVFKIIHPREEALKALCEFKATFSAADLACLTRNRVSIFCFDEEKLPEVLNLLVYAKIANFPLQKALQAVPRSTTPSRLEPYLELLTPEYISNNRDLFQ